MSFFMHNKVVLPIAHMSFEIKMAKAEFEIILVRPISEIPGIHQYRANDRIVQQG
jgi:hypothetical protein